MRPIDPGAVLTLHGQLRPVLGLMRRAHKGESELRLGELLDAVGPRGLVVAALVVALPFASPLSLGPITTPASVFLALVGWKIFRGHEGGASNRWRKMALPASFARAARRWIVALSRWRRWHRKSLPPAGAGEEFSCACGLGLLVAALLVGVPIPLLPLTNTFPALGAAAFCLALLLESRSWFLAGAALCALGVLVFAALGAAAWVVGMEGLARAVPALMG